MTAEEAAAMHAAAAAPTRLEAISTKEAAYVVEFPESVKVSAPHPGTPEFADECKKLDHRPLGYRAIKCAFDIIFSLCMIIVLLIPCLLLSIAIAIDTKGTPLYSQVRAGKYGKSFRIYKFRTMVADSDDVEKYLTPQQLEVWRRERKVEDDPRITPLGRKLRATGIDEFPQFINVLLGQISVIGPRAITFDELEHFGPDRELLLSVAPGITGLWQIGDRNSATFGNGTRQAIELDYVRKASLRTDLAIFFGTFGAMFTRRTGK